MHLSWKLRAMRHRIACLMGIHLLFLWEKYEYLKDYDHYKDTWGKPYCVRCRKVVK